MDAVASPLEPVRGSASTGGEHQLRMVSWNVTQRCNLNCRHCYVDAGRCHPAELTTAEALDVVDQIAAMGPGVLLVLSGGEPLQRPDLDALVERAASRDVFVVLGTNGGLLTTERAAKLAALGLAGVGISLDSLHASRHDEFRGAAGAWSAAVRAIDAARRAGLDVQLHLTLTPDNASELPGVVRLASSLGCRALNVFFLVCTGRGAHLATLTPAAHEQALEQLAELRSDDIIVRPRCAPTFRRILARSHPNSVLLAAGAGCCLAGTQYCRIDAQGHVTPCPYLPAEVGDLRRQPLADIWNNAPLFAALRHRNLGGACGHCEYRALCGGCRARAYALAGDALGADPWCAYVPGTDPPPARDDAVFAWSEEAERLLARVPAFARPMVRAAVEASARRDGIETISVEFLEQTRRRVGRRFGVPPRGSTTEVVG